MGGREGERSVPVARSQAGWKQSNIPTRCRHPANFVPVGREGGREGRERGREGEKCNMLSWDFIKGNMDQKINSRKRKRMKRGSFELRNEYIM